MNLVKEYYKRIAQVDIQPTMFPVEEGPDGGGFVHHMTREFLNSLPGLQGELETAGEPDWFTNQGKNILREYFKNNKVNKSHLKNFIESSGYTDKIVDGFVNNVASMINQHFFGN